MNFYFCESCGRRVTDKDLEVGAARNKQVKGVYCDDCAPGVSTITFEALRNEQLNIDRPATPPGIAQSQPPVKPRPRETRPKVVPHPAQQTSSKRALMAGIAILLALALSVVLAARHKSSAPITTAGGAPDPAPASTPTPGPESKSTPEPAATKSPTPLQPPAEPIAATEPERAPVVVQIPEPEVSDTSPAKVEVPAQPVLPENPEKAESAAPQPEKNVDVATVVAAPENPPATPTKPAPANEYLVTLQKGQQVPKFRIAKYSAVTECFLYTAWKDVPYNKYSKLLEEKKLIAQEGRHVPLIRFAVFRADGGVLPNDAEIVEAKLSLYKANLTASTIELYACLSPWDIEHVGWVQAEKNKVWKTPGGDASGKPVSSYATRRDAEWCEFDITPSVLQIQKEKRNFGWFLRASGTINQLKFHTSEAEDESLRPKLTIKIREPKR